MPTNPLGLAGAAGVSCLANGRFWQTAAFRLAQRMLRKLQENIFPHIRRQVHAIVHHGGAFLALQRQVAGPVVQRQVLLERLEAADALAFQVQMQTALHQQAVVQLLDLQIVLQGRRTWITSSCGSMSSSSSGKLPSRRDIVRLQMAQIDGQRHRTSF